MTASQLRLRMWVRRTAGTALVIGILVYGFCCYRVIMAGGFGPVTLRPACAQAATGEFTRYYLGSESVQIRRFYLPPRAVCVWSGGTTAEIVPLNAVSWSGPILIVAGITTLLAAARPAAKRGHAPPGRA